MELNKIHHLDNREGIAQLPEKCANLIISDPPYYEVKGEFDFIWKSFDEYLAFMEQQAQLYKRILADNGTLFVWGYYKHIAYVQVVFDKYFSLENSCTWIKKDGMQYQYYSVDTATAFTSNNERFLMYSNETSEAGISPFASYLRDEFKKAGVSTKEIAKLFPSVTGGLTGCVSNWLNGDNVITKEQYLKIRTYLNNEYLRKEYEDLRRPFYNTIKLSDCMEFSQEAHITKAYEHDTKKPETLTRALILTCSRPNDLVVVPFAGSGTECAMAAKEGRKFIGFDNNQKYVEMGNKRVLTHLQAPDLFRQAS